MYKGIYWGYIGIMEKKMETTGIIGVILGLYIVYIVYKGIYWGYIGITEENMETTIMGYIVVSQNRGTQI